MDIVSVGRLDDVVAVASVFDVADGSALAQLGAVVVLSGLPDSSVGICARLLYGRGLSWSCGLQTSPLTSGGLWTVQRWVNKVGRSPRSLPCDWTMVSHR